MLSVRIPAAMLVLVATPTLVTAQAIVGQAPNTLNAAEKTAGWRLLFDGQTTAGWHPYRGKGRVTGWQVINGELTLIVAGGDIVTDEQFADFELTLDWKIAPKGNSGVFFRATEDQEAIYQTAPEMQILDNAGHPDGQVALTSAGANYALHAPIRDVAKPAGEWNSARLLVRGNHVEHWLNGFKIVEYELGSPEWHTLVEGSKFKEWPTYGKAKRGHIGLQDHGDQVSFRNVKIRPMKTGPSILGFRSRTER